MQENSFARGFVEGALGVGKKLGAGFQKLSLKKPFQKPTAEIFFGEGVIPREATLFESVSGSVVEAFLVLRAQGTNLPPSWIEGAHESRKFGRRV